MLMVDMAHIAGLVAGGSHPSPSRTATWSPPPLADSSRPPWRADPVQGRVRQGDRSRRLPRHPGRPFMHVIAAKAVCLEEASSPGLQGIRVAGRVQRKGDGRRLEEQGFRVVSGGPTIPHDGGRPAHRHDGGGSGRRLARWDDRDEESAPVRPAPQQRPVGWDWAPRDHHAGIGEPRWRKLRDGRLGA